MLSLSIDNQNVMNDLNAMKLDNHKTLYTPASIMECFNNAFKTDVESAPVIIQGIYQPDSSNRLYGDYYYDSLAEEGGREILTLKVKPVLREKILAEKGKLVSVIGVLSRKTIPVKSSLQVMLILSFVLSAQKSTISKDEMRLADLSLLKTRKGYKGVDLAIKQILFSNRKPNIALLWATQSVVRTEFYNALGNGSKFIHFTDINTTFSQISETISKLKNLDGQFDAVALIRGGGSNLEVFSNPDLIEAVINMKTCTISAVGHAEEKHHLKKVTDLAVDTPTALGKFFSDIVETVVAERSNSKAILRQEVEKEYSKFIREQDTQIKTYIEQNNILTAEIKKFSDSGKKHDEQITSMQKMLEEKGKDADAANKRIRELTDELQKTTNKTIQQISDLSKEFNERNNTLTKELENRNKALDVKTEELSEKSREISTLLSRRHGISTSKVITIAVAAFIIGVAISLLVQ